MSSTQPAAQRPGLVEAWYKGACWLYCLLPAALFYRCLMFIRRCLYSAGLFKSYQAPVPVIVVGNITVGGTGKTPLVTAIVKQLKAAGYNPGIISRGYGSRAPYYPFEVTASSSASEAGDEPLLIAKASACPLFISGDREEAIEALLTKHHCDVIISDDGLQHYALQRDVEIVVIDGARLFGNGFCLPMGPLREPIKRLKSVDLAVVNGNEPCSNIPYMADRSFTMNLEPQNLIQLHGDKQIDLNDWSGEKRVHAVAGIGNPGRFYKTLRSLGFTVIEHDFPDHHNYTATDLEFSDDLPIIMTEKDAVKIASFSKKSYWYLPVEAKLKQSFYDALIYSLQPSSK